MENWNILVIDRSGSMIPNIKKIKDGFDNLVLEQKNNGSINKFTLVGFNSGVEIIRDEKFPDVSYIKHSELIFSGTTALLDAIGNVYDMIYYNENVKNKKYKTVTITIITDGFENSSKFYTIEELDEKKKLIDEKITLIILFIGTDYDCIRKNVINLHITQSFNCEGDIPSAFRMASKTMSETHENIETSPERDDINKFCMKRSFLECNSETLPPVIKRH